MASWDEVDKARLADLMAADEGNACTVVCLDAPPGLQLGVDIKAFAIGPQFRGVKLVPPGVRMLHYRLGGSDGPARAFFFKLGNSAATGDEAAKRVVALRWDPALEDFALVDEEDTARITAAVHRLELDATLGPYDPEHFARWENLTKFWDERVLAKAGIKCGVLVLGAGPDSSEDRRLGSSQPLGAAFCAPQFTTLPDLARLSKQMRADGAASNAKGEHFFRNASGGWLSPGEITALQLDPSNLVVRLLDVEYGASFADFLGEVQLAFVLFVYLASLPGLEFWKTAVHLVASSTELRTTEPEWVSQFCKTLGHQVFLLPKDMFQDELLADNFLCEALSALVDEEGAPPALQPNIAELRAALRQQYGASLLARLDAFVDDEERNFEAASLQPASSDLLAQAMEDTGLDDVQGPTPSPARTSERMAWMLP